MVSNLFLAHGEVTGQQKGGHQRKSSTVTRRYQAPTVSNKFQQSLLELLEKMERWRTSFKMLRKNDCRFRRLKYLLSDFRCNPFFIRCIKPNHMKVEFMSYNEVYIWMYRCQMVVISLLCSFLFCFQQPGMFEDELVTSQLRHSGILETIRIRREGFPVRMPFYAFLFRCLWIFFFLQKLLLNICTLIYVLIHVETMCIY